MKSTILGSKKWRWVVVIIMIIIFILGLSQCRGQCPGQDTVYGGQCNMYAITPVNTGNSSTECFVFKPETEIIHLTFMLAQGSGCGPFQYSNLSFTIRDTACNVIHMGTIFPVQNNTDVVLDTSMYYQMCLTFTASCTLNAICPQYNLSYLPIVLDYFQARMANKFTISIEWRSLSEYNSSLYRLERADSNFVFIPIYEEFTPVFSTTPRYYAYNDDLAPDGVVYYKLIQVDIDGCTTEFPIIAINNHKSIKSSLWDQWDIIGRQLKEQE